MQDLCDLNEVDDVLVDRYLHGLQIDIQHMLAFKNFDNVWVRSSSMPSRHKTLQIIRLENLVCLNGLHKRPHQGQILIQVLVPQKFFSQSLKIRIDSHVFIVSKTCIVHLNVQNE